MNLDTKKLTAELNGHTMVLTINNPPANTFDMESLGVIPGFIEELNYSEDVWSLVITGAGAKFFSAGADLNLFKSQDKAVARHMARLFGEAFEAISSFRGLSIAAMNGYAMGGGLECALACDIRVAEPQVQMALPEAAVGLAPCAGGTQLLPWLVGEGWAKRMIFLGERVNTETALRIGLIQETSGVGEALKRSLIMAAQAEKQSPSSIRACKKLIHAARQNPLQSALPLERELFVDLFDTKDQKEGVNAFLEKRSPLWTNS